MSAVIKEENARRSVRKMVIQAFVVATALAVVISLCYFVQIKDKMAKNINFLNEKDKMVLVTTLIL